MYWLFICLLAIGSLYSQAVGYRPTRVPFQGDRLPLGQIQSRGLHAELDALRSIRVQPIWEDAIAFGSENQIFAVALAQDGHPDDLLYVYYMEKLQISFYLHRTVNGKGRPEVRIWSDGESELLFTEEKMAMESAPSPSSFRLPSRFLKSRDRDLGAVDVLRCVGQSLGMTIDTTTVMSLLGSIACSAVGAKDSWSLYKTAAHCLSMASVGTATVVSTSFCIGGVAMDIACNLLGGCTDSSASPTPTPPNNCLSPIAPNTSVPGTWGPGCNSTQRQGRYARLFSFSVPARSSVVINLRSAQNLDTFLYLFRGTGNTGAVITADDDGGGSLQSRITTTLDAGAYTIEATTFDPGVSGAFGIDYTVQPVAAPPSAITGNQPCTATINVNQTVSGVWVTACVSPRRGGILSRQYTLVLSSQTRLQIDLESPAVDTYLTVSQGATGTGSVVETNDDGGVGLNSRIIRTFPAGTYSLECTPFSSGVSGNFTLAVRTGN